MSDTRAMTEKVSFIKFNTPVLTRVWTWWVSYITFDIYFPECLLSNVWISEVKILLATFFWRAPATSSPTLIIFILAKYRDKPLLEKAIIINDIMIDGKYNQKVNSKVHNIYFRGSNMQNKIYLKNMINDLLKSYSG